MKTTDAVVHPAVVCAETTDAVLRRAAHLVPDQEAVVCGSDRVTYGQLAESVSRIRTALARQGVTAGTHVAIAVGNGPRWMELFYAITSLAAVVVPLNTRFRADELEYQLRHSRATHLITAGRVLSSDLVAMVTGICPALATALPGSELPELRAVVVMDVDDVPGGALGWDEFLELGDAAPEADTRIAGPVPDDIALIQYTSGTTSRPKGVLLTHLNMCRNAFVSGQRMGLRSGDRFHSVRPFFHVAGSTLSVLSSAQLLATLVTMERFEPGAALAVMERERCTHFSGNDTIALMLLNHPDRLTRHLVLRGAWVAAAPPIVRRVIDDLGATECVVGYGQSEASPNIAQSTWDEDSEVRIAASMKPQPGLEVRIWDVLADQGQPAGGRGEIQVRGWSIMRGYFDDPEKTAEAFTTDGWLRTGDLGTLDDDGRLTFVGRLKDIIRVGGENVAPAEIEDLLHTHPAVKQAVVVGVPDDRLMEVPFAFVILNEGNDCPAEELRAWVKERLAGFKVPHDLRIVTDFADIGMTASSKIQRNKLAQHATELRKPQHA